MWRPRIYEGQVSIRRQGNLFVIVCGDKQESDELEKDVIKSLSHSRRLAEIRKKIRERLDR